MQKAVCNNAELRHLEIAEKKEKTNSRSVNICLIIWGK